MTKEEAIFAMENGEKVTHRVFLPEEYIYMSSGELYDEDGRHLYQHHFWQQRKGELWDTHWEIWSPKTE